MKFQEKRKVDINKTENPQSSSQLQDKKGETYTAQIYYGPNYDGTITTRLKRL